MMDWKVLIGGSNDACNIIAASYIKVGGESMSEIRFWNTSKGNLPHFFYILHKPDTVGTEFNTVAFYVTGLLLIVEI